MFVVHVAADIFTSKTNFEFSFPTRPTMLELTRATESGFSHEINLRRTDGVPPHSFHVAKLKFFDEDRNKWVDLLAETQMHEYCQIYAFQPENQWHKETQREIPQAVKPPTSSNVAARGVSYSRNPTNTSVTGNGAPVVTGSAVPQAATSRPRPTVDASEEEKLRIVFQEFDLKGNRMIDPEDLKQGFRTLGIEFTTATINDLFQKGDLNSDGRISFAEFERFAKVYPIMTNCLFLRSKAFWDEEAMNRELKAEKDAVLQAQQLATQAANNQAQAQQQLEDVNAEILKAENDIKDCQSRLRDAATSADQAQRDKDRAQKEKYDRETDLANQRDRERQAMQVVQDTQRDVDKVERRAAGLGNEAAKAEDRVKQIQQQLQEAQRAADRAQQNLKQAQNEVDSVRAREKDAQRNLETTNRELPKIEDAYRQADTNFSLANDRCKEVDMLQRDLNRDLDENGRRRDAGERAAGAARDSEAQAAAEVERARRAAEERERQAKAKEADLQEQQRQRQLVTQNERQLIEQELRLVEQRESLAAKESKLQSDATAFLSNVKANLNQRAPLSRDNSMASYGRNDSYPYSRGPSGY